MIDTTIIVITRTAAIHFALRLRVHFGLNLVQVEAISARFEVLAISQQYRPNELRVTMPECARYQVSNTERSKKCS